MRGTTRAKQQTLIAMVGVALLALACCFFIFVTESTRARRARMLERALAQLEQERNYSLVIIEKAPHYELSFRGRVESGTDLKGVLPDFDLEVALQKGKLRLRRENSAEWLDPDALKLEGLPGFLVTPLELLQARKDSFSEAVSGEEVTLEQGSCETVYFIVSEPEKLARFLFPDIDYAGISRIVMGAALAKSDESVKQLRVLVEFDSRGEQIERSYYLN
ncbi:MAG TPA: hypothetical protein GX744_08695 [Firmicutes bacterium]|nr:hypothetical protein [Bacillota bacterium]